MNRGAARQDVFIDRRDRRLFLALLEESVSKFGIEVHAYCLMGNHYHLLVRTPEPNLDLAVHHYASNYVRAFNARHGRDGPLFRSRYNSILIHDNAHVVAVSRYIHRNPIALGVVDLAGYTWSSLGAYLDRRRGPRWLHTSTILDHLGGPSSYRHLVEGPYGVEIEALLNQKHLPSAIGSPNGAAEASPEAA